MTKVLIAPLDWGLGHATRCIPVIRELGRQHCTVLVAGSGDSLLLLKREFPHLGFFSLPGYDPRYPLNGSMVWAMATQLPRFLRVISREHREIERIIADEKVNLLISDNRYGCWSQKIPCAFITHQNNVLMPKRFGWLQLFVRQSSDMLINRFDFRWIPDYPGANSHAGRLTETAVSELIAKTAYMGTLSRFEPRNRPGKQYDVVAVLSGPEPQRTALEGTLVPQLKASGLRFMVIRGLPNEQVRGTDDRIVNFLASDELQDCLEAADLVIARSGYSTVMDMSALGKKVVFIPTPGQTEQEYLASRMMEKGIAFFMKQNEFHLSTALQQSILYAGFTPLPANLLLEKTISDFLLRVSSRP
jgi:uncharacterized protein (TIGR00661 family)